MLRPEAIGIGAALGSAGCWALGSILFKRLTESMTPLALTLAKGAVSLVLLGIVAAAVGTGNVTTTSLGLLLLSGLLGIALGDTFFFAALRELTPTALVVFFMLGQMLTAVLAIVVLKEVPSAGALAGMAITLVGIAVVLSAQFGGEAEKRASTLRGLGFGLLSMVCMSVSLIVAKPALESVTTIWGTFVRMAAGTAGVLILGLTTGQVGPWLAPLKERPLQFQLVLSVVTVTFGGFWLSLVAIKYVDVAVANTLGATEPLFVLPLAALFLRQRISMREIGGAMLAALGVVVLCQSNG